MLKVIGLQPPANLEVLQLGGVCPHCNLGTRFSLAVRPNHRTSQDKAREIIAGYLCDSCLRAIGVLWQVQSADLSGNVAGSMPEMILRVREPFDFAHVPDSVKKEICEGLDCLSVNAYNAFAAMCRRAVQSICTSLGAEGSTKVQAQITEMAELIELDAEGKKVALEIMIAGHDGSHPHLPDVNSDRAAVLLSLVQDLVYQLFTRPGKLNESAKLRKAAIEKSATLRKAAIEEKK
jgi:Domain of unknown function (DUF4145)